MKNEIFQPDLLRSSGPDRSINATVDDSLRHGDGSRPARSDDAGEERPGYKFTKRTGWIPKDWRIQGISDLAADEQNATAGGPFGSRLVSDDYVPTGIPVIRGQNMGELWIGGDFACVSESKARSLSTNSAKPYDLVVTQRGSLGQASLVPDAPYPRYILSSRVR